MAAPASSKTVAERLQLKGERRLAALNGPLTVSDAIAGDRPRVAAEDADIVVLFVADRAEFDLLLPDAAKALKPGAILWLAYPKLTSSLAGDLNRDLIAREVPALGLDTVASIAIDSDWSALRLKQIA